MILRTLISKVTSLLRGTTSTAIAKPKYSEDQVIREKHILVIEDRAVHSQHLVAFFQEKGYRTIAIEGVIEFVEANIVIASAIDSHQPIVIDLQHTIAATVDFNLKGKFSG